MKKQKTFVSAKSNYSPNSSADRYRGISYRYSQLEVVENLIINRANIRALAIEIVNILQFNCGANVYKMVDNLIDECDKIHIQKLEKNNFELFSQVREYLLIMSRKGVS